MQIDMHLEIWSDFYLENEETFSYDMNSLSIEYIYDCFVW